MALLVKMLACQMLECQMLECQMLECQMLACQMLASNDMLLGSGAANGCSITFEFCITYGLASACQVQLLGQHEPRLVGGPFDLCVICM